MDRIFKIVLLSLEWQWRLLALDIIPIFFKNNVMKKSKIRSIKNIWTAVTVFSKSDTYIAAPDQKSREANIQLRSQALHFAKICSLLISSRNWSHFHENLLKSRGFYRFVLNVNVISFYFQLFFQRMLSHQLFYLSMRCLRLENYEFSRFFLWGQFYRLENAKLNALDLTKFRNQVHCRNFLRE